MSFDLTRVCEAIHETDGQGAVLDFVGKYFPDTRKGYCSACEIVSYVNEQGCCLVCGNGAEVRTVRVQRITLVVDEAWLETISELHSHRESGEVFQWVRTSNPFDFYIEEEYSVSFVGDKNHEAWAVVDSNGDEVEPSYWYDSREQALQAARERSSA